MHELPGRERTVLLDAIYDLNAVDRIDELAAAALPGVLRLIGADRAGWLTLDAVVGSIRGAHYPEPIPHLLVLLPSDLDQIPLVGPLLDQSSYAVTAISDYSSNRSWTARVLYNELYRPLGARFQMQVPVCFGAGGRVESVALTRGARDFTVANRSALAEFGRHLRQAHRRLHLRFGTVAEQAMRHGLTQRQGEALQAVADGATMPLAARRMGIAPKTLENHLQAAYRRLGVAGRLAALDRLRRD
jgi:DNA-binding CsgD family transcriptional regulator